MSTKKARRDGFTITEILVVVSVIAVLMAILLPSLASLRKTGDMTLSMSRMKQIGQWMTMYSTENSDFVLPSQFDFSGDQFRYKGKVRATVDMQTGTNQVNPAVGPRNAGTWADIIWTQFELGPLAMDGVPEATHDYSRDSPDTLAYKVFADLKNPLRSAGNNSRSFGTSEDDGIPRPWGQGAREGGEPGYFAANNIFNQTPAGDTDIGSWWTNGQIKRPADTLYLVDSVAGETIEPEPEPYDTDLSDGNEQATLEVDFRYNGNCLILFMDGNVKSQGPWGDLATLQDNRKIVVQNPSQP